MADDISLIVGVDYSQLTGLVKTGEQSKRVLSSAAKEFAKTGNQKQYMHAINKIVVAQKQLDVASRLSRKQLMKLGAEMQREIKFTNALSASTNKLGGSMSMAKNKMNGNNMAVQQLGYQMGDFAVQVQGGTSAFVAFSQQGAQLAGILPSIAGTLGLSMGAAVGLSAALGILIPIGSAVGRMFMEMGGQAKTLEQSLSGMDDAVSDFESDMAALDNYDLELLNGALSAMDTSMKSLAESSAALSKNLTFINAISSMKDLNLEVGFFKNLLSSVTGMFDNMFVKIDAAERKALQIKDIQADTLESFGFDEGLDLSKYKELIAQIKAGLESQDSFDVVQAIERLMTAATAGGVEDISEAGIEQLMTLGAIADAQQAIVDATAAGADLIAKKKEKELAAQKKVNDAAEEQIRLQKQAIELQAIELKVGKEHADYTQRAAKFERQNLALKMRQAKVDETLINSMLAGHNHLEVGLELIKKQADEAERLADAYKTAISKASKIKPNFAGVLDPRGESGSIVNAMRQGYEFPSDKDKPDKAKKERVKDPVAEFQKKLDLEREMYNVTEARRKVLQALGSDFARDNPKRAAEMEEKITKTNELIAVEKQRQALNDHIASSIEDGFMAMADGTKSVSDAFRTMAAEIVRELYKVYVMQVAIKALKLAMGIPFADGGVISGGSEVKAYADGGIVGGPTTFPMAGGKTGLMGEAGPEAIMPLKRGANGKLGVQAEGGSGDIYVTNNYSISANTSEDTKRLVTQTIQQAQPALTQAAKASIMNDRRRGGQMKSVFG